MRLFEALSTVPAPAPAPPPGARQGVPGRAHACLALRRDAAELAAAAARAAAYALCAAGAAVVAPAHRGSRGPALLPARAVTAVRAAVPPPPRISRRRFEEALAPHALRTRAAGGSLVALAALTGIEPACLYEQAQALRAAGAPR